MRRILAAGLAAVAMTMASAAPAAADDTRLKQVWGNGPACDLEAAFDRFERATDNLDVDGLSLREIRQALVAPDRAARTFENRLRRCSDVLDRQQASSPDGERAQRLLVDGLRLVGDGAGAFRDSLESIDDMTRARTPAEARRLERQARAALRRCERLMRRGGTSGENGERILERL